MTTRAAVWIERPTPTGVVVVDVEALAARGIVTGPDGRLRVPMDALQTIALVRQVDDLHAGLTLWALFPRAGA